ncbi:MAG: hypothetical protein NTW21_18685 [Verrucomicrobia bacterium]|nr:hypothetical protein [Verrucomicrobiota bacterium]
MDVLSGLSPDMPVFSAKHRQAARCTLDVAEAASADESMIESLGKSRKK